MPKINTDHLKISIAEIKEERTKDSGRFSVREQQVRQASMPIGELRDVVELTKTTYRKLQQAASPEQLSETLDIIEDTLNYAPIYWRRANLTKDELKEEVHHWTNKFGTGFMDICDYYQKRVKYSGKKIEAIFEKMRNATRPLTPAEARMITRMKDRMLPMCNDLLREWDAFCKSLSFNRNAIQNEKTPDTLGIQHMRENILGTQSQIERQETMIAELDYILASSQRLR